MRIKPAGLLSLHRDVAVWKKVKTHKAFFLILRKEIIKKDYHRTSNRMIQLQEMTSKYLKRLKTNEPSYTNRPVAHPQNVSMTLLKV